MYQMLCVLLATIAYGTATGHCQGPQAGMTAVTFQSSTYSDMRQLWAREATSGAVTVKAYLGFPEQARDRYPAAIIVHTIAGYRDANEGYAAVELRKAGFATLTYDSFAARGTTGAALQRLSGLILSGAVTRFGFVSGVGVSSMPNPRVNLTGEPYVTDGPRRVLFLNEPRQPFNQIDFLDWERVSP